MNNFLVDEAFKARNLAGSRLNSIDAALAIAERLKEMDQPQGVK